MQAMDASNEEEEEGELRELGVVALTARQFERQVEDQIDEELKLGSEKVDAENNEETTAQDALDELGKTCQDDDAASEDGEIADEDFVISSSEAQSDEDDEFLVEELDELGPSTSQERPGKSRASRSTTAKKPATKKKDEPLVDDADEKAFDARISRLFAEREQLRLREKRGESKKEEEEHSRVSGDNFFVPREVWRRLYKYQKTGVRWLASLLSQRAGGLLADEMGLGKTVQVCALIRALQTSECSGIGGGDVLTSGLGTSLIVAPATLLGQWLRELREWAPQTRVLIYHPSSRSSSQMRNWKTELLKKSRRPTLAGTIVLTSYGTLTKQRKKLVEVGWNLVIMDEGHAIRSPEAQVTLAAKELRTPYRFLLTGSPLQNNLKELWSLIDFVHPGRLGSLRTFDERFAIPITQGGYANASKLQAATAYRCAVVLRDAINPYILRRHKADVQKSVELPEKSEHVLFCELTALQRSLYKDFVSSRQCHAMLAGRLDVFQGLILLRKLCNHPDLVTGGANKYGDETNVDDLPEMTFGWYKNAGKLVVLRALLKLWAKEKEKRNKILVFSQSRRMLGVLERMLILEGHTYARMDGGTPIGRRQELVKRFNEGDEIYVFLLTTRVGGLGVNLTGANKVVIYDPDWNPSTDAQARERAYRIGQTRPVTIYRLVTAGTIEEKIYQRQIFKHLLANRILKGARQQRFFKTNHLHELFTLEDRKDANPGATETASLCAAVEPRVNYFDAKDAKNLKKKAKNKSKKGEGGAKEDEELEDEEEDEPLNERERQKLERIAEVAAKSQEDEQGDRIPCLRREKRQKRKRSRAKEEIATEDADILAKLLKKNVHSALAHDALLGDGGDLEANRRIAAEAEEVARLAAASVLRPAEKMRKEDWVAKLTKGYVKEGNGGGAGEDTKVEEAEKTMFEGKTAGFEKNDGENGEDFLATVRRRKNREMATSSSGARELNESRIPVERNRFTPLADELREFLAQERQATTDDIVKKFSKGVSAVDSPTFRALLRQIAILDKETGRWTLRPAYETVARY